MKQRGLTGGVLLIAAVAGAIGLSACTSSAPAASGGPVSVPPASSSSRAMPGPVTPGPSTPASSTEGQKVVAAQANPAANGLPGVIGPTGYGKLRIGMTRAQAMATGMIQPPGEYMPGCTFHSFYAGDKATYGEQVVISDKYGVVGITPPQRVGVRTISGRPSRS